MLKVVPSEAEIATALIRSGHPVVAANSGVIKALRDYFAEFLLRGEEDESDQVWATVGYDADGGAIYDWVRMQK